MCFTCISISSIVAITVCLILRSYQYRTHYSSYKSAYTVTGKTHNTIPANRLPENGPLDPKHVEYIQNLKLEY